MTIYVQRMLIQPCLFQNVVRNNGYFYQKALQALVDSGNWVEFDDSSRWREVMQGIIATGNNSAHVERKSKIAL